MTIRNLSTQVIDCDTCDDVFGDLVDMMIEVTLSLALKAGWKATRNGDYHQCPTCQNVRPSGKVGEKQAGGLCTPVYDADPGLEKRG